MTIAQAAALVTDATVKRGDSGNAVKTLQTLLNYRGAGVTVDSTFGADTENRLMEFQQALQLKADGIAGTITWNALRSGKVIARIPGSSINLREKPDRNSAVLETLAAESTVKIITRSALLDENYRWFQVETRQKTGWVREDLVQLFNPFTVPLPIVNNVVIQSRPIHWLMEINPKIEAAIRSVITLGFRDRVRYMFQVIDFADTTDLALIYLLGVGGTGGSTMLVMQPSTTGYRVIARLPVVQQPVIVSAQKTNGLPDLIVLTAGGGIPAAYRRLQFDGSTYPLPSGAPTVPAGTVISGGIAFASRITPDLAAPLVAV
jgi:Putative peptidoglycan binding domain/Bacterial SH3 domain